MSTPDKLDLSQVTTVLCDADGTLFPSEEPAFVASATVTQDFADRYGLRGDFSPEHLRITTTGKNFRTTAGELLAAVGVRADPDELETWVRREKAEVSDYLGTALSPVVDVVSGLAEVSKHYRLAAVSSSALSRLAACFTASDLDQFIAPETRFSAEDSLPTPTSKPHPAVYEFALRAVGATPGQAIAIEDSVTGAQSAVAAGIVTIGIVEFVPADERDQRVHDLMAAGVATVVDSWTELTQLLTSRPETAAVP